MEQQSICAEDLKYLLLNSCEPLVLKNILNWQLLKWDLQDWERLLENEELIFRCGKNEFTKEPQWERNTEIKKTTFKDFIASTKHNSKTWMYFDYKYLKDWFNAIEEINENINWKCVGFPEITSEDCTIWIGSKGAHTPCHIDTYGWNLVAQIYGRKQWLLFPPEENLKPSRIPYEESSIYSRLNFFTPVVNDFKGIGNCRKVTLNPGEILFVPHKWWHFVENLDTSISINVWLPSPQDNEERLKESLVQLFVAQFVNNISEESKNVILNPNSEEELKNLTFEGSLSVISSCRNIFTTCNKKIRLSEQSSADGPHLETTTDLIEMFNKYSFIHKVPKLSPAEFSLFLEEQRKRFDDVDQRLDSCADAKTKELVDLLNAFTHPEVVSLIKNKLLE